MAGPFLHGEENPPPPYEPYRDDENVQPVPMTELATPSNTRHTTAINTRSRSPSHDSNWLDGLVSVQVYLRQARPAARQHEASLAARVLGGCGRHKKLLIGLCVAAILLQLALVQHANPAQYDWRFESPQPGACVRRATQEFYARLVGSSPWTRMSTCMRTSYQGDGPESCRRGWWSQYGYWHRDNNTHCTPSWDAVEPHECISYATRRWTAQLTNVHYDRSRACRETPLVLAGGNAMTAPATCTMSGTGVRGEWRVLDENDATCVSQWTNFRAGICRFYNVREYTAQLARAAYDPWAACRDTPGNVNERRKGMPDECRLNQRGAMEGVWLVDEEPYCRPHWGPAKDGGCIAVDLRRYSARLWNADTGNWTTLCKTTPIELAGQTYRGAMLCIDEGILGMWGEWGLPDEHCVNFKEGLA